MATPGNESIEPPKLFDIPETWAAGEWEKGGYEDLLYEVFMTTLVNAGLSFRGLPVGLRRVPMYRGKHSAFWHLISEGAKEDERTPDMERCRYLPWVGWIVAASDRCPDISIFENKRGADTHVVLWYEAGNYAVILSKRSTYFVLVTAYSPAPDRQESFRRDRDEFNKRPQ
jgi:hypothetical protein